MFPLFLSLAFSLLFAPDTTNAPYLFSFGAFSTARAITIAPTGLVYIVDTGTNKVKVYTAGGDSVREVGGYGWGQLEFDRPYDVAAGSGLNVYVADYGNHRVQRFDKDLNYISSLYTRDADEASRRFGYPTGIAYSRLGDLFILDNENVRVVKVNSSSVVERNFGGIDAGKGRLWNPRHVCIAGSDLVCVLDDNRIVVFDYFGNFIRTIGQEVLEEPHGLTAERDTLYTADRRGIMMFDVDGRLLGMLRPSTAHGDSTATDAINDLAVYEGRIYAVVSTQVRVFERKPKNMLDNH
jgi:hypothetical protein